MELEDNQESELEASRSGSCFAPSKLEIASRHSTDDQGQQMQLLVTDRC